MAAAVTKVRSLCGGTGSRAVPYLTVRVRCWTSALEMRALSRAGGGAAWAHGGPPFLCPETQRGRDWLWVVLPWPGCTLPARAPRRGLSLRVPWCAVEGAQAGSLVTALLPTSLTWPSPRPCPPVSRWSVCTTGLPEDLPAGGVRSDVPGELRVLCPVPSPGVYPCPGTSEQLGVPGLRPTPQGPAVGGSGGYSSDPCEVGSYGPPCAGESVVFTPGLGQALCFRKQTRLPGGRVCLAGGGSGYISSVANLGGKPGRATNRAL